MALHKKVELLVSLQPDLAIIVECAKPEIVKNKREQF
jgi:hypothetical protein